MDTTATFAAVQFVRPIEGSYDGEREIISTGTFKQAAFARQDFYAALEDLTPENPAVELVTIHGNRIAASYAPNGF